MKIHFYSLEMNAIDCWWETNKERISFSYFHFKSYMYMHWMPFLCWEIDTANVYQIDSNYCIWKLRNWIQLATIINDQFSLCTRYTLYTTTDRCGSFF